MTGAVLGRIAGVRHEVAHGRLIYTWSFGEPDGELSVRNTAALRLVD